MVLSPCDQKIRIVIICGPTAVGKTGLSIRLALRFGGEIIGADSMQLYRGMEIGTAQPDQRERAMVSHHLVGVAEINDPYDAARYYREARSLILGVVQRGRLPFVVGGTGLYIKALLYGLCGSSPAEYQARERLAEEESRTGLAGLYQRLVVCDPETAKIVHPNDRYRIIRALAAYEATGVPLSRIRQEHGFARPFYDALKIGLIVDRKLLYERIDARVDQMIEKGFVDEVKELVSKGYGRKDRPMNALGYRHILDYIEGKCSLSESVSNMKRDTRRYAKRQLSWFRADPDIKWFSPEEYEAVEKRIETWLDRSLS